MPFRTVDDSNFTGGVNKELPSWSLPQGYLADASNMIFDIPGIARQRNGSTALSGPTTTAFSNGIGFCYFQDPASVTTEELYGVNGKTGAIGVINKTTGANTNLSTPGFVGTVGRPIRHFGHIIFPITPLTLTQRLQYYAAGSTVTTGYSNTTAQTMTAGNPTVTLTGGDVTTNMRVGSIFVMSNLGNQGYIGRVTSITSSTVFTVSPTPVFNQGTTGAGTATGTSTTTSGNGGTCGCSFQNRLLWGNTNDFVSALGNTVVLERRVYYSPLPTENTVVTISAVNWSGNTWLLGSGWPSLNYFDVPGSDPIVALEPISDNELMILTSQGVVILRGTLATQTSTSAPGITFDLSPLNTQAGCLSDLSVVRTPHGIIWASAEGVMLYTGGGRSPIDLTEGKYHTAWRNLTRQGAFAVHGAFYARNHYVVNGIGNGANWSLAFNMDNQTWAPLTGVGTDTFMGAVRPSDPSQVFVSRWWDISAAAPSQTGGHVIRVDSLFAPDVVGQTKTDSDGSVVAFSLTTRAVTDDMQSERILRRCAARYAATHGAFANLTVAVGSRLDVTDTVGTPTVSLGNLSNTAVMTITAQTNATPIAITTSGNHGYQSGDEVDIRGVTTNSNANGHWRIVVTGNNSFTLNGSSGNGATTLSGTVKKITEQELDASGADIGQANYLVVASAGTVNKFEWHGMRLGVMEMFRGMGR